MEISDLKPNMEGVSIELEIIDKGDIRDFIKFGQPGRLVYARGHDQTGEVFLTLWNEEIEKVFVGSRVKLINARVSEFKNNLCLSSGREGYIEIR